ncbi:hypothetical protein, partial [Rhodopseudomonas sp. BR0G17]
REGHYLLGIVTQLRALVGFDPTGKSKTLRPLLLNQADKFGIELSLFSRPPKPRKAEPNLVGSIIGYKTWSVLPGGDFCRYTLRDRLLVRAYYNDVTREYDNRNRLIRDMANKSAAHYDDHVSGFADSIRRSSGSNYTGEQFFVIDTSSAIYYLGVRFIRTMRALIDGRDPASDESIRGLDTEFQDLKISMI